MMVEHFIPRLSVLSPISRQECSLLISSGMWSVRVSGFYTEKQEMQDRTGQLFKFMYSDRSLSSYIHPKIPKPRTFRCNRNISLTISSPESENHLNINWCQCFNQILMEWKTKTKRIMVKNFKIIFFKNNNKNHTKSLTWHTGDKRNL